MASRRLTNALKSDIRDGLIFAVKKKMAESIPGKELAAIQKTLADFLMEEMSKTFTTNELTVLRKWGHVRAPGPVYMTKGKYVDKETKEESDAIASVWRNGSVDYFCVNFPDDFRAPDDYAYNDHRSMERLSKDPKIKALTLQGITMFNHINCETRETVNAYMEIVNTFTTVKKLVAAHPNLKKYVPEDERVPVTVSKKSKTIIKSFEDI